MEMSFTEAHVTATEFPFKVRGMLMSFTEVQNIRASAYPIQVMGILAGGGVVGGILNDYKGFEIFQEFFQFSGHCLCHKLYIKSVDLPRPKKRAS